METMATIEIHVPDELRRRMDDAKGEDWSEIARQAIERHLKRLSPQATPSHAFGTNGDEQRSRETVEQTRLENAAYDQGYAWARDRAVTRDVHAMVNAPNYRRAVDIVRGTKGFSQREFGYYAYPSDEMWEAFVDGATARYNEGAE